MRRPLRGAVAVTLSATLFLEACGGAAQRPTPAPGEPSRAAKVQKAETGRVHDTGELPEWFWITMGITLAVVIIAGGAFAISQAIK